MGALSIIGTVLNFAFPVLKDLLKGDSAAENIINIAEVLGPALTDSTNKGAAKMSAVVGFFAKLVDQLAAAGIVQVVRHEELQPFLQKTFDTMKANGTLVNNTPAAASSAPTGMIPAPPLYVLKKDIADK